MLNYIENHKIGQDLRFQKIYLLILKHRKAKNHFETL